MMKLISLKICPFVQRVAALLEAKNISYEIEYIDFKDTPQWFLDISPNAQVPILITDSGKVLFESDAIVEYIDEIDAPLEPDLTPEQRAIDRAWSYQASNLYLTQCGAMMSADEDTLKERSEKLELAFTKVESQLNGEPFFKGSQMSNLDIAWLPVLHRASIIKENTGYDFVDSYPKVKAWQSALLQTGLAEKSVSKDFNDVFKGLYLSDSTYLGAGKNCTDIEGSQCGSGDCCG